MVSLHDTVRLGAPNQAENHELGANSFLTKPVHLGEFKEMISAFHNYWIIHAQPAPKRGKLITPEQAA
jgi:hypothetical protein